MDVSRLSKRWPLLMDYLKSSGYSEGWCRTVNHLIRQVITLGCNPAILSYKDFYEYVKDEYASSRQVSIRSAINQIAYFDEKGLYPQRGRRVLFSEGKGYDALCMKYQKLILLLENLLGKQQLKETTIAGYRKTAVHFLGHLQQEGISKLHDCTEDAVLAYFYKDGKCIRGFRICQTLRKILKTLEPECRKGDCARILKWLPKSIQVRKPRRILSRFEVNRIKDAVLKKKPRVSLRDRAIVILALYAALKTREIAELKFENVDFENEKLILSDGDGTTQRCLPLRPVVGNAIYRYVKEERPKSSLPEIFLTTLSTPHPMSLNALRAAATNVYNAAGLGQKGRSKGLQPLRHGFATALLVDNTSTATVKEVMGVGTPEVVQTYAVSGYEQLKECGVSIKRWPVREEVLEDV